MFFFSGGGGGGWLGVVNSLLPGGVKRKEPNDHFCWLESKNSENDFEAPLYDCNFWKEGRFLVETSNFFSSPTSTYAF